ncbi:MAG: hypothetical protein HC850_15865 [Rhodomicrobium sp.]|nr:hypothetical protein [Rhodomicrobium sp.]
MRVYAFAAVLALSVFGITANAAKADYYCCGKQNSRHEFISERFYVIKEAVIFGCDGYHCETTVRLYSDINIKARCRNGWCEIRDLPLKNAWVLESCLQRTGYGKHSAHRGGFGRSNDEGNDDGNNRRNDSDESFEDEGGESEK